MIERPSRTANAAPSNLSPRSMLPRGCALAAATLAVLSACATATTTDATASNIGRLELVSRADGRVLPTYPDGQRRWVVGTPGHEYSVRVCNSTWGRVLAVISVDGVNVVSGETASPAQSGYVLSPRECTEIAGWRKSLAHTAAFYFTELPDTYAARTGRPDNVGVVGVAFFPERQAPVVTIERPTPRLAESRAAPSAAAPATTTPPTGSRAPAAESATEGASATASIGDTVARSQRLDSAAAKIGTGHGRTEDNPTRMVQFERANDTPAQTLTLHYDRRENLVAMGILPPPVAKSGANPFPAWAPRFVPDPPPR